MSQKSVILKPSKKLILPEEIPAVEAIRRGLALPPRRVGKHRLPAIPAGMGVFAKFAVEVIDKSGKKVAFPHPKTRKLIKKLEGPSHSFTRQLGFFMRGFMQNLDSAPNVNETLTDDGGVTFLARLKGPVTGSSAIISALAKIKFGASNAALSTTQTNLQGVLLGPTTEASVVVTLTVEDSTNTIFTVVGQILNGTGGVFNVEEMGLFAELTSQLNVSNNTTMMLRDLTGTVPVNNGQTIIGTWTFTIAV